jgi:4-alpha-glucanotransferase
MIELPLLRRLAELAGIGTRYRDAFGQEREVSAETIAAMLRVLGVGIGSPDEAAASVAALAEAPWRGALEPAAVRLDEEERPEVLVALPADAGAGALAWRIAFEDGGERRGDAAIAGLREVERREIGGRTLVRRALVLPRHLPLGYHRLELAGAGVAASMTLIVAPARCYLPPELEGGRAWALTTQLYALRSARNWGMGDFTDLAALGTGAARHGASALGVNPLHALFPAEPRHISPYSPSSRLFLNEFYIDVEAVPDFAESAAARAAAADPELRRRLEAARAGELVDHMAVAGCKKPLFRLLWESFRDNHLGADAAHPLTERGAAFRRFQEGGGRDLAIFATFQTLHEHLLEEGQSFCWRDWPAPMRDPNSPEVAAFAAERLDRIEYFQYLQWEADRQLGDAARLGEAAGLSIGIYRDLAVGVDGNSADAWGDQALYVPGAAVGAPPDPLGPQGQNWGLVPLSPLELKRRAYAPFVAALRANMRHAGALRVDHVMALHHLYWIPPGADATGGAYVRYPFEDLVRLVALESRRHRCAVIGEDLGTVPEGFRERMHDANILSYRLLVFERRHDGSFIPPQGYPALASASVTTHDLPTLKGYWLGRDIEWRERLHQYRDDGARNAARGDRARERRLLLDALVREGVLPPGAAGELLPEADRPVFSHTLAEAVHRYLGHAAARLMLVQIEDATGELEQANLPGTVDEHPNWRRKLSSRVEDILGDAWFKQLAAAVSEARRRR